MNIYYMWRRTSMSVDGAMDDLDVDEKEHNLFKLF
jgi:hypothetical protein